VTAATHFTPVTRLRSDTKIKKQIKERLYWNPIINSPNIKTEVKDGRAVLTGFAATQLEKSTVTIEVYQGGAEVVDNEFGVTSEPEIVNE